MKELTAESHRELLEVLSTIDISVAPRGDKKNKRSKEQVERWSICRFLATYANTRYLRYPFYITKRERPDYLLNSRGRRIGVEVTEAVSEDFARLDAMRQDSEELILVDTSLFRPDSQARTKKELRDILENQPHGPGWAGNAVERDWASVMFSVIRAKSASARKPGYAHFDENWLLIYDNWSLPQLDENEGLKLLLGKLSELWSNATFTNVFIERNENFLNVSAPTCDARGIVDVRTR